MDELSEAEVRARIDALFPDGKCREFPFNPKSRRIPIDYDAVGNLIEWNEDWAGDWQDFAPCLWGEGCQPGNEAHVQIKALCTAVANAAQKSKDERASKGLTPVAGRGTCRATYVQAPPLPAQQSPATHTEEKNAKVDEYARELREASRRGRVWAKRAAEVLRIFSGDHHCGTIEDIAKRIKGVNSRQNLGDAVAWLNERGLIETTPRVGTDITDAGRDVYARYQAIDAAAGFRCVGDRKRA